MPYLRKRFSKRLGNGWVMASRLNLRTLQWRHNESDGVSSHRRLDCLLNCLFRPGSEMISKHRVTGLFEENSPVTGEFPVQRASKAENDTIWWRRHDFITHQCPTVCPRLLILYPPNWSVETHKFICFSVIFDNKWHRPLSWKASPTSSCIFNTITVKELVTHGEYVGIGTRTL